MSRYRCLPCGNEYSMENMTPVCPMCFYKEKQTKQAQKAYVVDLKESLAVETERSSMLLADLNKAEAQVSALHAVLDGMGFQEMDCADCDRNQVNVLKALAICLGEKP